MTAILKKTKYSILITTKNRSADLAYTLSKLEDLLLRDDVLCVVTDDGSSDDTTDFVKKHYPQVVLYTNKVSKGYLFCRNRMLNQSQSEYCISLDDDAHFVTENPLEAIDSTFKKFPRAGVLALRIIWTKADTFTSFTDDKILPVQSFVGCGHVWRRDVWRTIPDYPEWFIFYGEENFASYHLYKINMDVIYTPGVLVQHRVDLKSRRLQNDYGLRLRRSLFTGWSLFFLFYPKAYILRRLAYSIWMQIKLKVLKGDVIALKSLILAFFDLLIASPKFIRQRNALSKSQFKAFQEVHTAIIYWTPK